MSVTQPSELPCDPSGGPCCIQGHGVGAMLHTRLANKDVRGAVGKASHTHTAEMSPWHLVPPSPASPIMHFRPPSCTPASSIA